MKNIMKKLVAILTVFAVMLTAMPVAMAGVSNVDVEDAYYECASIYPEFVDAVVANGATESLIISFLSDVQNYLLGTGAEITEENFEEYFVEAILDTMAKRKHVKVRDALAKAYPDAVVDGMDGVIAPEFQPLVETIKLILFGRYEEETTEEVTEPTQEESQAPTEDKEEEPTEKETETPTEEATVKPSNPDGGIGGPVGGEDEEVEMPTEVVTEAPTRPASKTFSDINQAPWAEKAIYALVDMGVINGYPDKTFKPNNPVTRAEFAKMITLASGRYIEKDKATYVSNFWDVPNTAWEYSYVSAALKFGFITGRSETIFDPASNITRGDLCLIVYRYIKSINSEFKAKENVIVSFADSAMVPSWDIEAVNVLASHSIATARDTVNNKFEPLLPATRAECAVMIYEAMNAALGLK